MIKNGRYCVNGTVQPKTYKKNLNNFSGGTRMISKYSVKRPYTVLVAVVLVIVLGVVSLTRMTTDLLPAMNLPYVIVVTTDVGASPEEVV